MAIELTAIAAERVRGFIERDGGIGLRLGVKKTGCSGWAYTVDVATEVQPDDVVFEQDDVKVVVAPDSLTIGEIIFNTNLMLQGTNFIQ